MRNLRHLGPVVLRSRPNTIRTSLRLPGTLSTLSKSRHLTTTPAPLAKQPVIPVTQLPDSPSLAEEATIRTAEEPSVALESRDILEVYRSLVARGLLEWDEEQVRCVMRVCLYPSHNSWELMVSDSCFSLGNSSRNCKTTPRRSTSSPSSPPTHPSSRAKPSKPNAKAAAPHGGKASRAPTAPPS